MNNWVNNREAGDLRRHPIHYDVTVMDLHSMHRTPGAIGTFVGRRKQNGRHFVDEISMQTFLNEMILFWLKFHDNKFVRA